MKFPTEIEATKFLESNGWGTWHGGGWFHEKIVADPKKQDPTNYTMNWKSAYLHEIKNLPPFPSMGLPGLSQKFVDRPDFTEEEWDWLRQ